jgi:gamma-glutamylcyclotransferase (GGCT)/AIG2-like uncharacterized protein YtfP
MENLFAYGTLMLSNIQQELFGRELEGESDILNNYIKNEITIDNEVYSCVDESAGNNTHGVLYQVTPEELGQADKYEGIEYKRIKIVLARGLEAWVYVRA